MDQQEYGRYLLAMGGEEFKLADDKEVEADHLYGFFSGLCHLEQALNVCLSRFQTASFFG